MKLKIFGKSEHREALLSNLITSDKICQETFISFKQFIPILKTSPNLPDYSIVLMEANRPHKAYVLKHYKNLSFISFDITFLEGIVGLLIVISKLHPDLNFKAKIIYANCKIDILFKAGKMSAPKDIDYFNELANILEKEQNVVNRLRFNLIIEEILTQLAKSLEFKEFKIHWTPIVDEVYWELIGLWNEGSGVCITIRNYMPAPFSVVCSSLDGSRVEALDLTLLRNPFLLKEELQKYRKTGGKR
jgi:hypothetical protein